MNEIQINAQFTTLIEQRNAALNQVVNLSGEIAILKSKVAELEAKLIAPEATIEED